MAEVKWIKIVTDIFDDEKILLIETMPESDSIIVIWFKLLCLSGKQNNSGVFQMSNGIPYTDKMLATIFRRKETIVQLALKTFEQFGMVRIINDTVTIPNWEKHQSIDELSKIRENNRKRVEKHRKKQEQITGNVTVTLPVTLHNDDCNVTVTEDVTLCNGIDKIRIDKIREDEMRTDDNAEKVRMLFNKICNSFQQCQKLTSEREKNIKILLSVYSLEQIEEVFRKCESSDFLKGKSNSNFKARFDWIIKPDNFIKIFEGNYDDNKPKAEENGFNIDDYKSLINNHIPF